MLSTIAFAKYQKHLRQYTSKHAWLRDKLEYGEKQCVYPIHNNKFVNFWLEMPQKP
jgi:hypothetical protein